MKGFRERYGGDVVAMLLLLLLCGVFLIDDITLPAEYAFSDMVAFFAPFYTYLGDGLRQFDIYGWNPHQFSGAPFAADPESGWMYLPVMLIYSLIPHGAASYLVHAFVHLAIASIGCYVFARMLGLNRIGSFAASASAILSQMMNTTGCCPPLAQVPAWLPWMLIGAELSIRAQTRLARFGGWALAAFATSQVLAAWLGQGSYYALLFMAAWIGWRIFFAPNAPAPPLLSRIVTNAIDGIAILLLAFGLSAAGLLPRILFNTVSTIPGGVYQHEQGDFSIGWSLANVLTAVFSGYFGGLRWYLGAAAIVLAIASPVIARRWAHMPFFLAISLMTIILTLNIQTPIHLLLYTLLPRFELMHDHAPERILIIAALPVAMLAGAAISWLPRWVGSRKPLVAAAVIPFVVFAVIQYASGGPDPAITTRAMIVMAATAALLLIAAWMLSPNPASSIALKIVPLSLIALIIWDPAGMVLGNHLVRNHWRWEAETDLDEYLARTPAAEFIAGQSAADPARFFGFDPTRLPEPGQLYRGYLKQESDPEGLILNNRATALGIDTPQGYNPIHLLRYIEYIDALNGTPQDYHETSVLTSGVDSPLLDLLNARFVIVPMPAVYDSQRRAERNPEHPDLARLRSTLPVVFEDERVQVLERTTAMPRAWLVHDARQLPRGEALPLLAGGDVDPRVTALLEAPPPSLEQPPAGAAESARYVSREPDRIDLQVTAAAPALLVLSEVYESGWSATVDGAAAPVLVANHVLRAVPVPAGEHTVVLRYEPPGLKIGIAITLVTILAMIAAAVVLRARRPQSAPGDREAA